ncbi:MAG: RraA family protein [Chloroflexi bacterium]|nr:RraA family protein [Chloroflexota bacterium]
MALWQSDEELFALARNELFPAVVGDVMDKLGLLHQFLPPQIKPLGSSMVVIGRAMTVLEEDLTEQSTPGDADERTRNPFGLMFHALDTMKPQEVYICTGASPTYALWGGLMSTRARLLGAAGAVVNGYSRDTNEILSLNFPTFSFGGYAQDQGARGWVVDFRSPIEMDGVRVDPGDIVFGDIDGVCIIPQRAEREVFTAALEKARGEQHVRKALESGMGTVEAFESFGIM